MKYDLIYHPFKLQQLHSDAQHLLKIQEAQHHEQMKQAKISQQKLVVFCQKLEAKRKTEKGVESDLKNEMSRLNSTLCEKEEMISKLEEEKARQDEETIALRFQIQERLTGFYSTSFLQDGDSI